MKQILYIEAAEYQGVDKPEHYDSDGACACGEITGTTITSHCHRTCNECIYAGVHFKRDEDKNIAIQLGKYLSDVYFCDISIMKE